MAKKAFSNYRLSSKQARKLGVHHLANVGVRVHYMSDKDKRRLGIAQGVIMAEIVQYGSAVIATNLALNGVPKPKRKYE